jgi:Arm DNA-binding domain
LVLRKYGILPDGYRIPLHPLEQQRHVPCGHNADIGAVAERLTDKLVRDLPPPARGNKIHYDMAVRGLGVRVTSAGARSWVFNYRARGVERRLTIGDTKAWTVRAARDKANELRRLVDNGHDPMAVRHAQRRQRGGANDGAAGMSDPAPVRSVNLQPWIENWWNQTKNPLYAWEAICRSLNSGEEIPNWALEYLRSAADNMMWLAIGRDFRCADAKRIDADQCVKLVGEALGLWREATKNEFARRANDAVAAHTALAEDFAGREFAHQELN